MGALDDRRASGRAVTAVRPAARVVLIGPECTGKTWLAQGLARHYVVPWSEEYARLFVEEHPRPVALADVDAIARGQIEVEDQALAEARHAGSRVVIHDTDLISTEVYSRHYYGRAPEWIAPLALARRADLYLLHHPDVPWTQDGYQRAEPGRRDELFARFRDTLAALGAAVTPITGTWDRRRESAIAAIDGLLGEP
jgi:NadR type nicotinamide-nucleotide adenylyltransferase